MQAEDQVAEWLVQWEEALTAGQPLPSLDQLPPELRPRARAGLRLLRGFAGMPHALASTGPAPPADAPRGVPRTRRATASRSSWPGAAWARSGAAATRCCSATVALKVLRQRILGDGRDRARFEEEARLVGQLEHPSIVPVRDLGELPDGRPFFVMKLIHGQTLAELLAARATPAEDLPRWVEVFEQICEAVAFAHARGLIHRDLKPSNVMLGEFGEVQVMDWGIAKVLAARPQPAAASATPARLSPSVGLATTGDAGGLGTLPGQAKGTPAFMAPEQASGEASRVGKATDVFGLGGILCVMLTGEPPYTHVGQVLAGNTEEAFARLDGCGADAELIELAKACLAPEPEARPADAAEVARRVKDYREGSPRDRPRRSGCCGSARQERRSPRPPRTPVRGSGNRPGRCSAPKWRRRRSGCRVPAPPRRPPPARCSKLFAGFPSWPASATRRRWPNSPSPSGRRGNRSGRRSKNS